LKFRRDSSGRRPADKAADVKRTMDKTLTDRTTTGSGNSVLYAVHSLVCSVTERSRVTEGGVLNLLPWNRIRGAGGNSKNSQIENITELSDQ